jgi:glycerol-3-phosphate dehydrogenase
MHDELDVLVVGGGVVGCAVARELSKFQIKVCLAEMGRDVAGGASKANSGVIHSGINSKPGSLKARMCMEGNAALPSLAKELNVPFSMTGKIVIAKDDSELKKLEEQRDWGLANGTIGMRELNEKEIHGMEPNIVGKYGLWVPGAGIIPPYALTIGFAENAATNGVRFLLGAEVTGVNAKESIFKVNTTRGTIKAKHVVNCAGLHCDEVARMVGVDRYKVNPCRGEYHILDKEYSSLITHSVYPVPPAETSVLGVHFTTTLEGNILVGPSAEFIPERDDTKTTRQVMDQLIKEAKELLPAFPTRGLIKSYAGVRCKLKDTLTGNEMPDFVVEEEPKGFINLMGIESPGLTASPALAVLVLGIIGKSIPLKRKDRFNRTGFKYTRLSNLRNDRRADYVKMNPAYGEVVCRCEDVTKGEIEETLTNPLGAATMVSVKYRCRAMMGRCQAGFCGPKIAQIIEEKGEIDPTEVVLNGKDSRLFVKRVKG